MRLIKPELRELAKDVRNNSIDTAGCAEAKDTLLASVARCVARGDQKLLSLLWKRHQVVREHVEKRGD
eukprot:1339929-Karenia_brevis.AAC.1